jgi:hypothetical protein
VQIQCAAVRGMATYPMLGKGQDRHGQVTCISDLKHIKRQATREQGDREAGREGGAYQTKQWCSGRCAGKKHATSIESALGQGRGQETRKGGRGAQCDHDIVLLRTMVSALCRSTCSTRMSWAMVAARSAHMRARDAEVVVEGEEEGERADHGAWPPPSASSPSTGPARTWGPGGTPPAPARSRGSEGAPGPPTPTPTPPVDKRTQFGCAGPRSMEEPVLEGSRWAEVSSG